MHQALPGQAPCRAWCPYCAKGRGRNAPHEAQQDKDEGDDLKVPRIGMDYMFLSEKGVTSKREEAPEDLSECITMLVIKEFWFGKTNKT